VSAEIELDQGTHDVRRSASDQAHAEGVAVLEYLMRRRARDESPDDHQICVGLSLDPARDEYCRCGSRHLRKKIDAKHEEEVSHPVRELSAT
jgi:hypothetical protein